MYRSGMGAAVLALVAAMGMVRPAQSQVPATSASARNEAERTLLRSEIERLESTLDRLDRRISERTARLEASLAARAGERIVRRVGAFVLHGTPEMLEGPEGAVQSVRDVWNTWSEDVGDLSFIPDLRMDIVAASELSGSDMRPGPDHSRIRWSPGTSVGHAARAEATRMIMDHRPSRLVAWTGDTGWSKSGGGRSGYRALLESTHHLALRCSQLTDAEACSQFLFLDFDGSRAGDREALLRWFPDPAALADAVERVSPADRPPACILGLETWNHGTCVDLIVTEHPVLGLAPSTPVSRGGLLRVALRADPDGRGLARAAALPASSSVSDQLEAISGIQISELVASWLDQMTVADESPMRRTGGGPGPFTLLWSGAFALLALRSTRWRLG